MKTLTQCIAEYRESFRQRVDQATQDTMQAASEALIASGIEKQALQCGDRIPPFVLANQHRELRDSRQLLSRPLVISFYRGGWCPYCNLELAAQQARLADIRNAGADLIAISPEQPELAQVMESKHQLSFDILFDQDNALARKFGLVFSLPMALREVYKKFSIDIEKFNGNDHFELPLPATYIVDRDGIIRFDFIYADYRRRLDPEQLLVQLEKISQSQQVASP